MLEETSFALAVWTSLKRRMNSEMMWWFRFNDDVGDVGPSENYRTLLLLLWEF